MTGLLTKMEEIEKQTMFGFVEKAENGRVYTIEEISNDRCCQRKYDINSQYILEYGISMY